MKKYKEASEIFDLIKHSKKIVLSLHVSPDPDSTGSNLALYHALKNLGKEVEVISFDKPPERLTFLPGFQEIKNEGLAKKDLSSFDLYIALDSGALSQISRIPVEFPEDLTIINIDHHYTNPKYGKINLVDGEIGSCGELLFNLLTEWNLEITKDIANCLFAAIAGDTGMFRYSNAVNENTFDAAEKLMKAGASLSDVTFNLFQRVPFPAMKFWGYALNKMEVIKTKKYNFVWCALSNEDLQKFPDIDSTSGASDMFLSIAEGTDFGILLTERDKGMLRGSARSRTGLDVGELTGILGGGGHKMAAGFRFDLEGKSFQAGTDELLKSIKHILDAQF
jgi:bifunctional oligoribonuclease and PAP phosphatase NrnA